MKSKLTGIFFELVCFAFILLFVYTAASKVLTFGKFSETLGKLPLVGAYHAVLAFLIPAVEILISLLLVFSRTKRPGLIASLVLMSLFTVFLGYMVATVEYLPCSCGGVIAQLSWRQHILFNFGFILAALFALLPGKNEDQLPDAHLTSTRYKDFRAENREMP